MEKSTDPLLDQKFWTLCLTRRMFNVDVCVTSWLTAETGFLLEVSAQTLTTEDKLFSYLIRFNESDVDDLLSGERDLIAILRDGLCNQSMRYPYYWEETRIIVKIKNSLNDHPEDWDEMKKDVLYNFSSSLRAMKRMH